MRAADLLKDVLEESQKHIIEINDYLTQRSIADEATLSKFGLGYIPNTGMILSAMKNRDWDTQEALDLAVRLNLLISVGPKSYSSFFDRRLVFPIYDVYGRLIGIAGRVLEKDRKPKYFNTTFSKGKNLYGLNLAIDAVLKEGFLIVVEGYMDVISAHKLGAYNVVAVMGTAFTNDHGIIISRYTNNVYLLLDGDKAGKTSTERYLQKRAPNPLVMKVTPKNLPGPYGDLDEFVVKNPQEALHFIRAGIKQKS